jgi:hypothetical protein
MVQTVRVHTQGITDDWSQAHGDHDTVDRGLLTHEQVFSALHHASRLSVPEGDDVCPPHILIAGEAGDFSFVGEHGKLFCPEIGTELRPDEGASLAFGMVQADDLKPASTPRPARPAIGQPPPPVGRNEVQETPTVVKSAAGPETSKAQRVAGVLGVVAGAAVGGGMAGGADVAREAATGAVLGSGSAMAPAQKPKRRFTWRTWLGLFLGGCFLLAGLISIAGIDQASRSSNEEDLWAALVITGALLVIGIVIVIAALKSRPYEATDGNGVMTGVAMAHMMTMNEHHDLWDDPGHD